ncbi:MAG: F0F1 ATP synthase subunit A, partial [Silvanigrellaceae bacterium]|nr:F0F1 ATP synthase subunit A [Silvanigrellaceae bacterium]
LIFPLNYIVGTIMFPLKFLGEFASVISMSFRLFGNIFGGFIIASIYYGGIGNSIILNILGIPINFAIISFFVIFEGFLQAFVFSMLAITNIGMAIQSKEGH